MSTKIYLNTGKAMSGDVEKSVEAAGEEICDIIQSSGADVDASEKLGAYFEDIIADVFLQKRDFFIHAIRQKLVGMSLQSNQPEVTDEGEEWIQILSLSRLRSVVGGRFQNLKDKWIEAGFPLREHRGDTGAQYEVSEEGWIAISNWIAGQGFEARLASSDSKHLFEVRKRE
jgi:hypothetical protein